jgi:hypothetical protein
MKKHVTFAISFLLLLSTVGCGNTGEQVSSEPVELTVFDLNDTLDALDLSEATLAYYGENENTCDAFRAIRAESYLETLKCFTWEEYHAPDGWDGSDGGFRCVLTAPGVTITAFQDNALPLQVVTDSGEGMFVLPYLTDEQNGDTKQVSWMVFDTFEQWYGEAHTATLCGGAGTPLTAEQMDWFEDYTASEKTSYDETWGGYIVSATEISCFFTSQYSDPRDMDAQEFLRYCPGEGTLGAADEEEFRYVQAKLDWRSGEDNHLFTVTELPVPCHRLPRSYINEILTKYAGITVEEMHTDWLTEAVYIPETDCFYTFTSDFGPGTFTPSYGEISDDIVTLWDAPSGESGVSDLLVLQKSGEDWHILSHQPTTIS